MKETPTSNNAMRKYLMRFASDMFSSLSLCDKNLPGHCFMKRETRQALKVIQKPARPRRAAAPTALVESRAGVQAELLPTLRENKEIHFAFRADGNVFLRPLRHVIHKHPGHEVRPLLMQQADPGLRTDCRRPPIRPDDEPAGEPMFNPVQLEVHRRLGPWGYCGAPDSPDDRRPGVLRGLTEGEASRGMRDAQ